MTHDLSFMVGVLKPASLGLCVDLKSDLMSPKNETLTIPSAIVHDWPMRAAFDARAIALQTRTKLSITALTLRDVNGGDR